MGNLRQVKMVITVFLFVCFFFETEFYYIGCVCVCLCLLCCVKTGFLCVALAVDRVGLKPVSASRVLGLKLCTTTTQVLHCSLKGKLNKS